MNTENTYFTWSHFVDDFDKQVMHAEETYNELKADGLVDFTYVKLSPCFVSDKKDNLERLKKYLTDNYSYLFIANDSRENTFILKMETVSLPVTKDTLIYWALNMSKCGYDFDCKFDTYQAETTQASELPVFDKAEESTYFNKAVSCFNLGNLSGAIANWSVAITINKNNADAYYSRAVAKNQLFTWKSALNDYDKALAIVPDFVVALLNRRNP